MGGAPLLARISVCVCVECAEHEPVTAGALLCRATYLYCLYCGRQFETVEELEAECPGVWAESHDDEED